MSVRLEPVTVTERETRIKATCPRCGSKAQAVKLLIYRGSGAPLLSETRDFQMACGCYIRATDWTLRWWIDPSQAWFEVAR